MAKKKSEYPQDVIAEAKLRRMRPEDYCHQMAECSMAAQRMAEIDAKKLEEMKNEGFESEELVSPSKQDVYDYC